MSFLQATLNFLYGRHYRTVFMVCMVTSRSRISVESLQNTLNKITTQTYSLRYDFCFRSGTLIVLFENMLSGFRNTYKNLYLYLCEEAKSEEGKDS